MRLVFRCIRKFACLPFATVINGKYLLFAYKYFFCAQKVGKIGQAKLSSPTVCVLAVIWSSLFVRSLFRCIRKFACLLFDTIKNGIYLLFAYK